MHHGLWPALVTNLQHSAKMKIRRTCRPFAFPSYPQFPLRRKKAVCARAFQLWFW